MAEEKASEIESPLEQRPVQWTLLAVGSCCLVVMLSTGAIKWHSTWSGLAPEAGVSLDDFDPSVGYLQIDINRAPALCGRFCSRGQPAPIPSLTG